MAELAVTFPDDLIDHLATLVADKLELAKAAGAEGFLNVEGAAEYLASTPDAVRALVKSHRIPVHRTPAGRLLFDREELRRWVMDG
jgi:excisionase family DNA binding protein